MNLLKLARRIRSAIRLLPNRLGVGTCVIHDGGLINSMPPEKLLKTFCWPGKGRVKSPENLTICLVHNYPEETIMEKSLSYLGIDDFVVLRLDIDPWRHTEKLRAMYKFLCSDDPRATREYIMFSDANDAILARDPRYAISLLRQSGSDLLFSATGWAGGLVFAPEKREYFERIMREETKKSKGTAFINTGCYIGTTAFLREVLEDNLRFITDDDLTPAELKAAVNSGSLPEKVVKAGFPAAFGCDQALMAYLPDEYLKRIRVDYYHRLAFRCR